MREKEKERGSGTRPPFQLLDKLREGKKKRKDFLPFLWFVSRRRGRGFFSFLLIRALGKGTGRKEYKRLFLLFSPFLLLRFLKCNKK